MTKKPALFVAAIILLSGCNADIPKLEKKILERDPSFREILEVKASMLKELEGTRTDYLKQKQLREAKLVSIKQDLERARAEYVSRMERIKKKLDPEITSLKNDIKKLKMEAAVRNSELRVIENNISEIKELVQKGKSLEMTQEEMRMWNERMTSLVKKRDETIRTRDKIVQEAETAELKISVITGR